MKLLTAFPRDVDSVYGGKKAYLISNLIRVMDALFLLPRPLTHVQLSKVRRLVFACKGNICRSPYGAMRAKKLGMLTASFGLDATTGKPANPSAIRVGASRGLNLEHHQATHLHDFCFEDGDLVLVFEPNQLSKLRIPGVLPKGVAADPIGRWCRPKFPYLHDPYGLDDAYFNVCFERIDIALEYFLQCILLLKKSNHAPFDPDT